MFEGSVDNGIRTTLTAANPTSARTITLPDETGTVVTSAGSGVVTSTMILDGTIVNADINASAAIALSKLATGALPSGITVASTNIVDGTIVNADINASAAIADTKLATISTAGKVSNSATTATSANTANAIVARDASGNFSAGTVTASLTGNASTATKLSSTRTFAVTGDITGTVSSDLTSGASIAAAIAPGVIVNADVNASAAIAGTKISPDFGSQNIVTTGTASAANILYNRRPALHRGPLFYKTAATTISIVAGSVLNGHLYSTATAVTMPSHTNNTDYAIWQNPTTGALVSNASFTTAPAGATGGSIVGGYHYIPSGRPTAFNNGSPTAAAEILEFSIWDLTWRPECPDPRGMACIDGRFWCDLYLCGCHQLCGYCFQRSA